MAFPVTHLPGAAVVTLRGEFVGGAHAPAFRETIAALGGAGQPRVVADLSPVTLMDSSALGALIEAATTLRALGGDLRMAGMESCPRMIWLVSVFRLHNVFALYGTVEEAAASFEAADVEAAA